MIDKIFFILLAPLTRLVNDPINIFFISPNIIFYHVLFNKYMWISKILFVSIGLKSTEKKFTASFHPVFLELLILKSSETLPKRSA